MTEESIPLKPLLQPSATSSSVDEDLENFHSPLSMETNPAWKPGDQEAFQYHRDFLKRPFRGQRRNDMFLNPYDGRLCDLVVQSSSGVLESNPPARWFRTGLQNGSPWMIRLSNWALSRDHGSAETVGTNVGEAILRWIPACLALAMVTSLPIQVAATPSNNGRYDVFLYKDWRYPLDARNKMENKLHSNVKNQEGQNDTQKRTNVGQIERLVEPDYLCFLNSRDKIEWSKVSEWTSHNGRETHTSYVFVSFIGTQFSTKSDKDYLREVGRHAAKATGVRAYWISTSCLYDLHEKDKDKINRQSEKTVWSMSDIIRRASAIAIAVSGPLDSQCNGDSLYEWGNRVWTMPELLLYTGHHDIFVYDRTKSRDERQIIPRRELWNKVWRDVGYSGQLIDHYEKSVTLSPLELITVALQCLHKRNTNVYANGDRSYVLMGLLRQRPNVVRSDSAFQAFARLSLANDSNMLVERLICMLPKSLDEDWWSLNDAWNVVPWDIYPKIQICGLGHDDTVILDGAHGAAIRWDKFVPVLTLGQESMRHRLIRWTIRAMPGIFLTGLIWVLSSSLKGDKIHALVAVSSVILSLSGVIVFLLPYLIRAIYRAEVRDSQPFFFGLEGYVDIYHLEILIFGSYEGRLQWSTSSSPLSHHSLDREGMKADFFQDMAPQSADLERHLERENMFTGLDPVNHDSRTKDLVEKAKTSSEFENKVFTLVDTYTMTVTLFEAVRPPVAVVLCGAEGGMQRALLCSEDWTSGTLYRETVMRMETRVWDRMDTMARVRLGLKRDDSRNALSDPQSYSVKKANRLRRFMNAVGARVLRARG